MKKMQVQLPEQYKMSIFPESIDFIIPGFEKTYHYPIKTLALTKRDCAQWYNEFVDRVLNACGKDFLPVCRMSDGEYLFLLGEQPFDTRLNFLTKLRYRLSRFKHEVLLQGGLGAFTQGHYHSGQYSKDEWLEARKEYPEAIREISRKGIVAWHLEHTDKPFQERYFPVFEKWLIDEEINLTDDSYCPFYFVYAMLTGMRRGELFKNRKVLVVNGAEGEDKEKIIEGLKREGVSEVIWCPISLKRSLYDTIDVKPYIGKVDFAIVGAGLGKANIMTQMEALSVPCIDAGFVFEVWKNPENKWVRVFCAPDEDRDELTVESDNK